MAENAHPGNIRAENRPQPEHNECQVNVQTATLWKISKTKMTETVDPHVNRQLAAGMKKK
jgi:hypothetical protein